MCEVTLIAVRTNAQLADLLTKPLPDNLFQRFQDKVLNRIIIRPFD